MTIQAQLLNSPPHLLIMLFIFGNVIGFLPVLHFQIGNDVLSSDSRCFITPHPAQFFNASQVMPLLAMPHALGRLASKLIQPLMQYGVAVAELGGCLLTVLFKRGHKI